MLPIYLAATVPIWIDHLKILDATLFEATRKRWSLQQAETIIQVDKDDILLALRARAQAIAAEAFNPNGVSAFGMHWQACRAL
jgi:hypothetical protein